MGRKLPTLIVNPERREEGERYLAGRWRTLAIMLASMVMGGLIAAIVIIWVVEMPLVALVLVIAEAVAMTFFFRSQRSAAEASKPDLVVASSWLRGIEVGNFASDEAIWQAATLMRAGGQGASEQAQALVAI